jgi:hypothetical protein
LKPVKYQVPESNTTQPPRPAAPSTVKKERELRQHNACNAAATIGTLHVQLLHLLRAAKRLQE